MRKSIFYLCSLFLVLGCSERTNKEARSIDDSELISAKALVENNDYIDVDKDALNFSEMIGNDDVASVEGNKIKAAYYRFFQHVKLEDGRYVCDVEDAKDLNISPRLFNALLKEIEQVNVEIENAEKENIPITIPELNEEYLQSLLE